MNKRLALILFGISYEERHNHWANIYWYQDNPIFLRIDYQLSLDNYKKYIYSYFQDYEIDVFMCTNQSHMFGTCAADYNAKMASVCNHPDPDKFRTLRNQRLITASQHCCDYAKIDNIKYDLVMITRFDLEFQIPFDKVFIDMNKVNIVSRLENENLICDNFYIMPFRYLSDFVDMWKENIDTSGHYVQQLIEKISPINYLYDQNTLLQSLDFYKIVRNYV